MKKYILLIFLALSFIEIQGQVYTSNKISTWNRSSNTIEINDKLNNKLMSLKMNFEYNKHFKKWIKTFKIQDQSYLISKESKGMQYVYTKGWELVAKMNKDGNSIELLKPGKLFIKSNEKKWFGNPELTYVDLKGNVIAKSAKAKNSKYIYTLIGEDELDILLMTLIVHQYDEEVQRKNSMLNIVALTNY